MKWDKAGIKLEVSKAVWNQKHSWTVSSKWFTDSYGVVDVRGVQENAKGG